MGDAIVGVGAGVFIQSSLPGIEGELSIRRICLP